MAEPKQYKLKPNQITAMILDGTPQDTMDAYHWVESLTQGSFDPFDVAASGDGVSIDPATGQMMIATKNGVIFVKKGEWIIQNQDGSWAKTDHATFSSMYETADGSDMPQPTPPTDPEPPADASTTA